MGTPTSWWATSARRARPWSRSGRTWGASDDPGRAAPRDRAPGLCGQSRPRPGAGVRKEDFSVTDEGQVQTIVSFDVIQRLGLERGPSGAGSRSRPRLVTNASGPAERGRLFVLVFDNLHLSPLNAQRAKAAVAAFLDKGVRDGDRVSLISTGGGAWWTTRMPEGRSDLLAILKNLDGRRFPESATDRLTDYEAV